MGRRFVHKTKREKQKCKEQYPRIPLYVVQKDGEEKKTRVLGKKTNALEKMVIA